VARCSDAARHRIDQEAANESASTSPAGSARLLLPPTAIADRGHRSVRDQEYLQWVNLFQTIAKYAPPGYVRITDDELDGLPSGVSRLLQALFVPSEGRMSVPTFGTNVIYLNAHLNHSTRPNMRTKDGYTFTRAG
jgi:hypothetical protein